MSVHISYITLGTSFELPGTVPLIQPYLLPASWVFVSCLTDKRPPGALSALRCSPSVGKEARKGYVVIIAFKKVNRNSQFYSRCWKCCPPDRSQCGELRLSMFTVEFFRWNSWNLAEDVLLWPWKLVLPMPYCTVAVVRTWWPFVQTFSKSISPELFAQKGILWVKFQVLARISSNLSSVSTVHCLSGSLFSIDSVVFKLLTRLYILCFLEVNGLETGTKNLYDIFEATQNIWNTAELKACTMISSVNLNRGVLFCEFMMEKSVYQYQTCGH